MGILQQGARNGEGGRALRRAPQNGTKWGLRGGCSRGLFALFLSLAAPAFGAAEYTPPRAKPLPPDPARVIVQYKAQAALLEKRLSAATERNLAAEVQALQQRALQLGARAGVPLSAGLGLSERSQVVIAAGLSSAALAARLSQDPDVEFAVPDERMRPLRVPDDPLYQSGGAAGPASGQWYLHPPSATTPASMNAQQAWDLTRGDSSVIVAVLDTGVLDDHPDLAGKLLPGYDMVNDPTIANDGGGRDADAYDPGDWVTASEAGNAPFNDCEATNSSWHGTMVAGLIAGATDNGTGMAGAGWGVRVLPVRVLGKCFGFSSEIIAGMRWAAGLAVDGVPTNPNPAKVLNLSLGSSNSCSPAYQAAVNEITALGKIIVAAAGNSAGHSVGQPANCQGVIAVAGLRHIGTKVGFSDLGSQIAVAAPAGNCVTPTAGGCQYPILTTTNAGTTTPVAASAAYTDASNVSVGTSFSSPLVAATVALMASVRPSLTVSEARSFLQASARAFPFRGAGDSVPACVTPTGTDQDECYCTSSLCGAGMLDAHGAVAGAIGLVPAIGVSASPTAAQAVTLTSASTQVPSGRSVASISWSLVDDGGIVSGFTSSTNADTAMLLPSAAGRFTVRLTVTDSAGLDSSAETTVAVAEPPAPASGGGGGGATGLVALLSLAAATWLLRRNRRQSKLFS